MKDPDEINKNIRKVMEEDPEESDSEENLGEAPGDKDLVPKNMYTGGLEPVLENYIPEGLELTKQEMQFFKKGITRVSSGLRANMPITCYGEKCPFKNQCPLHQIGKAPVGKPCPVEAILLDMYTKRYLDEFEVDSDLMSEVTTMTMLAATHVLEMRAFILLGKDDQENPDGLVKNVVGFNNDDEPIVQLQEHPAYNQIERAWRWRRNLLESLVGTRKEKYKRDAAIGDNMGNSASTAAADLKSTIQKMTIVDVTGDE